MIYLTITTRHHDASRRDAINPTVLCALDRKPKLKKKKTNLYDNQKEKKIQNGTCEKNNVEQPEKTTLLDCDSTPNGLRDGRGGCFTVRFSLSKRGGSTYLPFSKGISLEVEKRRRVKPKSVSFFFLTQSPSFRAHTLKFTLITSSLITFTLRFKCL